MAIKLRRNIAGITPEMASQELERIYDENREITAKLIVDSARSKKSVLHPIFEWDDKKAGEQYRLWQARQLVRAIVVMDDVTGMETPKYVHVTISDSKQGQYMPSEVVVENVDMFARALSELHQKIKSLQKLITALESMARESNDSDRMMRVAIAIKALENAGSAIQAIH